MMKHNLHFHVSCLANFLSANCPLAKTYVFALKRTVSLRPTAHVWWRNENNNSLGTLIWMPDFDILLFIINIYDYLDVSSLFTESKILNRYD